MIDFMQSLQKKVEADTLGVLSARDGIIESFVVSNRTALGMGLSGIAIDASDQEVYEQVKAIMSQLLSERGGNFDSPTVSELRSVRHTIYLKLRFSELPPEIVDNHDVICETLLNKTSVQATEEGIVKPQSLDEPLAGTSIEEALREELNKPEPDAAVSEPQPFSKPSGFVELKPGALSSIAPEESTPAETEEPSPEIPQPAPMENPFQVSLDSKMKYDVLSPTDARDGIIESYSRLLLDSISQGVNPWGFEVTEKEVETLVRGMMRDVFAELGTSFEEPAPDILAQALEKLAARLDLAACPEPVRVRNRETCEVLIAKTRKLVDAVAGTPSVLEAAETTEREDAVSQPVRQLEPGDPEHAVAGSSPPSSDMPSMDSILARVRSELHRMVSEEIGSIMEVRKHEPVRPRPPAGVAASSHGETVFLAWLDAFEQPGYHVYLKKDGDWERLTRVPLIRPSFRLQMEEKGDYIFAVSSISLQGVESELSPEVKVTV